jgi:hypothetical protein
MSVGATTLGCPSPSLAKVTKNAKRIICALASLYFRRGWSEWSTTANRDVAGSPAAPSSARRCAAPSSARRCGPRNRGEPYSTAYAGAALSSAKRGPERPRFLLWEEKRGSAPKASRRGEPPSGGPEACAGLLAGGQLQLVDARGAAFDRDAPRRRRRRRVSGHRRVGGSLLRDHGRQAGFGARVPRGPGRLCSSEISLLLRWDHVRYGRDPSVGLITCERVEGPFLPGRRYHVRSRHRSDSGVRYLIRSSPAVLIVAGWRPPGALDPFWRCTANRACTATYSSLRSRRAKWLRSVG